MGIRFISTGMMKEITLTVVNINSSSKGIKEKSWKTAPSTKGPKNPTTFTPFAEDVSVVAGSIYDAITNGKNSNRYPQIARQLVEMGPIALDIMARVASRHVKSADRGRIARHLAANMEKQHVAALRKAARERRSFYANAT